MWKNNSGLDCVIFSFHYTWKLEILILFVYLLWKNYFYKLMNDLCFHYKRCSDETTAVSTVGIICYLP